MDAIKLKEKESFDDEYEDDSNGPLSDYSSDNISTPLEFPNLMEGLEEVQKAKNEHRETHQKEMTEEENDTETETNRQMTEEEIRRLQPSLVSSDPTITEEKEPIKLPNFHGTTLNDPNQVLEHVDPKDFEYYHTCNSLALKDFYKVIDEEEPDVYEDKDLLYSRANGNTDLGSDRDTIWNLENDGNEAPKTSEEPTPIIFESRYECGNLDRVYRAKKPNTFVMFMRYDINTHRHTQWFNFSVKGLKKEVAYTFLFVNNTRKTVSLFNAGLKPLVYSVNLGEGWRRTGENICYYETKRSMPQKDHKQNFMSLGFQYTPKVENDTAYFVQLYPYTYTQMKRDVEKLEAKIASTNGEIYYTKKILTKTCGGLDCDLLTISSKGSTKEIEEKPVVLLSARVHPGEVQSSYMMRGTLNYLISSEAKDLRDKYTFYVVPMLNPDGVYSGNQRCNLHGLDLNRQWKEPTPEESPTIYYWKEFMMRIQNQSKDKIRLYVDYHGHSRKKNIFIYGCNSKFRSKKLPLRVYPLLLSQITNSLVNFDDCQFNLLKSKSTTARIVTFKEVGIQNAYTCEASLCGPADENMEAINLKDSSFSRSRAHYRTQNYENCGQFLVTTLREIDDDIKVAKAMSELEELFPPQVKKILTRKQKQKRLRKRFAVQAKAQLAEGDDGVVVHVPTSKPLKNVLKNPAKPVSEAELDQFIFTLICMSPICLLVLVIMCVFSGIFYN